MKFWWSRKKEEPEPAVRHGALTTYKKGCRCDECRTATVAKVRRWQRQVQEEFKRTGELPPFVFHGTYNAYQNYQCRCVDCKAASSAYYRARKQKAMAK